MTEPQPDMRPWYLAGGLAVVLVGGIALIVATQPGGGEDVAAPAKVVSAPSAVAVAPVAPLPGIPQRSSDERLSLAAQAALGQRGAVTRQRDGMASTERAIRVVDLPFGPVLLTETRIPDGCHACSGFLNAYYLTETATGFDVKSRHPEAVPGSGWGEPPRWQFSDRYLSLPVIESGTGGMWQGHSCSWTALTALTPDGPKELVAFLASYSNEGAVGEEGVDFGGNPAQQFEGRVSAVSRNRSFTVSYSGSLNVTETYRYADGVFTLPRGESKAQGC